MKKLLIGCYGWDYDLWSPQFYPEELPPSWRFCFYSNEIRSVLVPWAVLSRATAEQISTWVEESDDGFEFVLEISGAPSADESDRLCVLSAPLAGRISAWTCSDPGASATGDSIARLAPVGHAQIAAPGSVWPRIPITSLGAWPAALAVLVPEFDPKSLRDALERLSPLLENGCTVGIFFTHPRHAPEHALAARTLSEMMGF